jgi:uncharacterized integral membrane protein
MIGTYFLSGGNIVALILALIVGFLIFYAYVFGRAAKLRAEITQTKRTIELIAGDNVPS